MATVAEVRARARAIVAPLRAQPRRIAERGLALLELDEQLAFEVFRASKAGVLTLTPAEIEGMLPVLHDWNSTDCFACFVSGVAWREGVLNDGQVTVWARAPELWTRRAALASTIPLNLTARGARNPKGEARKTLAICALLVDDHEDMVVKAMSWALRTLGAKDADAVRAFIDARRERLAARVLRETGNKFATGLKSPRKR